MKIAELKETRAAKIAEMRVLADNAGGENRDLDDGERKRFDALDAEARALGNRLTDAEKLAEFERLVATAEPVSGGSGGMDIRQHSLSKAINESLGDGATGFEGEYHQEHSRGRETRGIVVPSPLERRAILTSQPADGPGGYLVPTTLGPLMDRRRAQTVVGRAGATPLPNLSGNVDMPALVESGQGYWLGEHDAVTRSDPKFGRKSMAPHTHALEYELSRRMRLQAAPAIDQVLERDLARMQAEGIDRAALVGGGTNEPVGILSDTAVPRMTYTGPIAPDAASLLIASLNTQDVPDDTAAFVTSPQLMNAARLLRDTDGRLIPTAETFFAKPIFTTTLMPIDVGAEGDKLALIFGDFSSLYIGYWSSVDILANPYSADVASKGGLLLHCFQDIDVCVREPQAFAVAELD